MTPGRPAAGAPGVRAATGTGDPALSRSAVGPSRRHRSCPDPTVGPTPTWPASSRKLMFDLYYVKKFQLGGRMRASSSPRRFMFSSRSWLTGGSFALAP